MWFKRKKPAEFSSKGTLDPKYDAIIEYFQRHRFGSQPPVMSILSRLPIKDRCEILSHLHSLDPSNVYIYDKITMAYAKSGDKVNATKYLKDGINRKVVDAFTASHFAEKIEHFAQNAGNLGSTQNHSQALQLIKQDMSLEDEEMRVQCAEFNRIVCEFCESQIS